MCPALQPADLAAALQGWSEERLAALLSRRPDVLEGRPPGDLLGLARRLMDGHSLVRLMRGSPQPLLQVTEILAGLGESATRERVTQLLAENQQHLDAVLAELADSAVILPGQGDELLVPPALPGIFGAPLGLGPPLRALLGEVTVDMMRKALRSLGQPQEGNKAALTERLMAHLSDPVTVRGLVSQAPQPLQETLLHLAAPMPDTESALFGDDDDEDYYSPREPPLPPRQLLSWAAERLLVAMPNWGYAVTMSAEVGLALRGTSYQIPFTPHRPQVSSRPIPPAAVNTEAGTAITRLTDVVTSLLDRLERLPCPALKSGGIGVREVSRLAKELGCTEPEARLALETAGAAGLLAFAERSVSVSAGYAQWRSDDPGERMSGILRAWWDMPSAAIRDTGPKGGQAALRQPPCSGCRLARTALLTVMATLPDDAATDTASVAGAVRWQSPLACATVDPGGPPFGWVWTEAELIGAIARGALSPVGAALLAGDTEDLTRQLVTLLPASSDWAVFGSDLTAYVVGAPSRTVSAVLDTVGEREGRGGATTWRITPGSVRRALDAGHDAAELEASLAAVATTPLPQTLSYLLRDVARKHGTVRVGEFASYLRSDDEPLLRQISLDRALRSLGLRLLAPTVLASALPGAQTLAALRKAGYLPMPEAAAAPARPVDNRPKAAGRGGADAGVRQSTAILDLLRGRGVTAGAVPDAPGGDDGDDGEAAPTMDAAAQAARALLTAGVGVGVAPATGYAAALAQSARRLDPLAIEQLAWAIDERARVGIVYRSGSGAVTRRVIDEPILSGGQILAWCELRNAERVFTISEILEVYPPDN